MEIIVAATTAEFSAAAAEYICEQVRSNPQIVLGVATGSSPLPVYEYLSWHRRADFSAVQCFALDEYLGLPATHEQSYANFVRRRISTPLGIPAGNTHVPNTEQDDAAACDEYENLIKASGGIDLQILGIGRNGHLAFNEPGSPFNSRTRVVALTHDSREANSRFFPSLEDVPTHAITQGLGTIQEARHLLVVANGEHKAAAVSRAVNGPITEDMPASILQLHPNVTLVLDEPAASLLTVTNAY